MLKTQIGAVFKQAITTFSCNREYFFQNLELLRFLLEKTTADDVGLQEEFASENLWNVQGKAPVSCIDIYDNPNFTMGIFVLKAGMKLPLHDHPEMYGLIKVVLGKVQVTSYSINTEKTNEIDTRSLQGAQLPGSFYKKLHKSSVRTAERVSQDIVDVHSECLVLEPDKRNLHEIESLDGPAAFIDILAPPYFSMIPDVGPRICHYYSILTQVHSNVFKLQEINSPSWYWTDSYPYNGPPVNEENVEN